jgi:hypothetical protein
VRHEVNSEVWIPRPSLIRLPGEILQAQMEV